MSIITSEALRKMRAGEHHLDLSGKDLTDDDVRAISDELKDNSTLTSLLFGFLSLGNRLGDLSAQALAGALRANATLTKLSICNNEIGPAGAQALSDALKVNHSLVELYLQNNKVGDAGAMHIADALKANHTLTLLNLGRNEVGPAGTEAIVEALDSHNASILYLELCRKNNNDPPALRAAKEANRVLQSHFPRKTLTAPALQALVAGNFQSIPPPRPQLQKLQHAAAHSAGWLLKRDVASSALPAAHQVLSSLPRDHPARASLERAIAFASAPAPPRVPPRAPAPDPVEALQAQIAELQAQALKREIPFAELRFGPGGGSLFEGTWRGVPVSLRKAANLSEELEVLDRVGNAPHFPLLLGVSRDPEEEGNSFFVHELLPLGTLDKHLESHTPSARESLLIIRQVAEALSILHSHNVLFGDAEVLLASLVPLSVKVTRFGPLVALDDLSRERDISSLRTLARRLFKDNIICEPVLDRLAGPADLTAVLQAITDALPLCPPPATQRPPPPPWECPICFEPRDDKVVLDNCGHVFCVEDAEMATTTGRCPTCRAPFTGHRKVFF
jgi:hypothetical protein